MAYSPRRREYLPGEENRYNTNGDLQERRHTAGGTLDARGDSHRTEALVGPTREGRYGHPRSMQCAGGKRCPNFHNPGVQVIKEVCISYEKGLSWLSEWYHVLASFHSRFFPGTSTLHLYPYCDDGTTGHYHLIAHSSKTLCWLCQQTNFDSGPLGIHDERQLQYWSHAEYMPKNETCLGLEQAKGFITCGIPDSGGIGLEGPPTSTFTQELESLRSRADQPTKSDHTLRLDRLSSHAGTSGTTNARPLTRRPSSTSSIKARSRRSKVCRKYDNRLDDTAIAKGLHRSLYGSSRISRFEACSEDSAVCPECVDCSEALGHVGLSPTAPITWPEINQSVHRPSSPAAIPGTTIHENSKRALVIGINYDSSRLEGAGRLLFAVNDAERVARSLSRHGFPDDNAVILTDRDGERQNRATHRAIMEQISRLVVNAKPGDTLFFFFSGHGCHNHPLHGTGLITADDQIISQRQLENALVAQVPAGCELHVFIDSCRASSMIQLPHCVERMHFKPDRPSSAVPVIPYVFFLASNLPFCPPTPPMPATHGSSARFTFPSPCFELAGMELAPGTTNGRDRDQGTLIESGQVQDACHEEPKTVGSVKTTGGMVFFWPSTGDYYNAFESYNAPGVRNGVEVRNGIMANALCDALDNRVDKQPSIRAVWESLVKNIEEENRWRQERDSKKSPTQQAKLTPGSRVQLAELWISQYGSLSTIASVLDLPLFSN